MGKCLLVIGGSNEAVPGIIRAKEMGLHVVVSDKNPEAPGFNYADDKILASTYDIEETCAGSQKYSSEIRKIDGVISMCSDVPLTVSVVAETLGLPGNSISTAKLSSDKIEMKKKLRECGIAIPEFCEVYNPTDIKQFIDKGFSRIVVKPADGRGARGVQLVNSKTKFEEIFNYAKKFSSSGRVLVEEFIEGPQFSTESLIVDGVGYAIGFGERNYEYLERFTPFIIENGGQQPSEIGKSEVEKIHQLAINAGLAIGINNGIVKGDMVLSAMGPKVIEIAARLSGGWFSSDQIPLGTGVDLIGNAVKLALGQKPLHSDLIPNYSNGVAIRYFFPPPGKIVSIYDYSEIEKKDWVHKIKFFMKPGDRIEKTTDHTKRAGFVITTGENREQAVERAEWVVNNINIKIE